MANPPSDLAFFSSEFGIVTPFGTLLPPGGRLAAFVRATAVDADPPYIEENRVTTLAEAMKRCRTVGDTIIVLPGHTESVADATSFNANLVAGTRIIGVGTGSKMPTFSWTATAGSWVVDENDVVIMGLRLHADGANGITKAISVTGADFTFIHNDVSVAAGAALKSTIVMEIGAAAHRANISNNRFRGTATHNVTQGISVAGAASDVRICDNEMVASATAANGLINVSAAALGLVILRNIIANTMTSSTACIAFGNVACTGVCAYNALSTLNDGTAAAQGVTFGAAALIRAVENYSCDEPKKSGALAPAACAT